jgi:hypothetical protein
MLGRRVLWPHHGRPRLDDASLEIRSKVGLLAAAVGRFPAMLSKARHEVGRLWGKASNNQIMAGIIAGVVLLVIGALYVDLTGGGQKRLEITVTSSKSPLRVDVQPKPEEFFDIAFDHNIGMPAANEGWASLHERGGIDNVASLFELTLANRSPTSLTVTNIEAVVFKSWPAPSAWDGTQASQGGNGLAQFSAWLTSATPRTGVPVSQSGSGGGKLNGPPYFETHYISLQPGEIYQAAITIISTVEDRELEYGFVVDGNTAASSFMVTTTPKQLITRGRFYAHNYVHVSGRDNTEACWIVETASDFGIAHCP